MTENFLFIREAANLVFGKNELVVSDNIKTPLVPLINSGSTPNSLDIFAARLVA
jgi:hypothetical protein